MRKGFLTSSAALLSHRVWERVCAYLINIWCRNILKGTEIHAACNVCVLMAVCSVECVHK